MHFSDELYDKVFKNTHWLTIRILIIPKPIHHSCNSLEKSFFYQVYLPYLLLFLHFLPQRWGFLPYLLKDIFILQVCP